MRYWSQDVFQSEYGEVSQPYQDLDMLNETYAATFQLPVLRALRGELRHMLQRSRHLKAKLAARIESSESFSGERWANSLSYLSS